MNANYRLEKSDPEELRALTGLWRLALTNNPRLRTSADKLVSSGLVSRDTIENIFVIMSTGCRIPINRLHDISGVPPLLSPAENQPDRTYPRSTLPEDQSIIIASSVANHANRLYLALGEWKRTSSALSVAESDLTDFKTMDKLEKLDEGLRASLRNEARSVEVMRQTCDKCRWSIVDLVGTASAEQYLKLN